MSFGNLSGGVGVYNACAGAGVLKSILARKLIVILKPLGAHAYRSARFFGANAFMSAHFYERTLL